MYTQAKALVEEGTYSYWFDMEEIEVLDKHNENFRAQENEEQLLPILFDVPAEGMGRVYDNGRDKRTIGYLWRHQEAYEYETIRSITK